MSQRNLQWAETIRWLSHQAASLLALTLTEDVNTDVQLEALVGEYTEETITAIESYLRSRIREIPPHEEVDGRNLRQATRITLTRLREWRNNRPPQGEHHE